jgi:hypothetical protein
VLIARAAARALAHRQHDAAHRGSGRDRANPVASVNQRTCRDRRRAGRMITWRRGAAHRARARRRRPRGGLHSVLLLRGGGEPADESGARSVRQDSRVQVLRDTRERGWIEGARGYSSAQDNVPA